MLPAPVVRNNLNARRFEVQLEGHTAILLYTLHSRTLILTHTEVPAELEGRGIGSALAKAGLDYAHAAGLRVRPLCPFVRAYLQRHPEYLDLVES